MKILAIDPGAKKVGLASCDSLGLTTQGRGVLVFSKTPKLVQDLLALIEKEEFSKVLVGHPLNMDGSAGAAAKRSESLRKQLERACQGAGLSCEIILWDERLTSFEAEQRLRDQGISKKKGKDQVDSLAAQVLLEDYLRESRPTQLT